MGGYFIILSIIGIGVGIFLVNLGFHGEGLGSTLTLIIGLFVTIKEILDIFNSR